MIIYTREHTLPRVMAMLSILFALASSSFLLISWSRYSNSTMSLVISPGILYPRK